MQKEIVHEESYEGIFGKGIMLIVGLSYLLFLFIGGHNVSWQGLDLFKIWGVVGILIFYIWHFKLVLDDNLNKITNGFYTILTYSIVNIFIATAFSVQYLIAFAMYQGLLINGYTGSIYYKGVALLKAQIMEGHYKELAANIVKNKEVEKEVPVEVLENMEETNKITNNK